MRITSSGPSPELFRRDLVAKMERAARIRAQEYANAYDKSWRVILGRRRGPSSPGQPPGFRTGRLRDAPFSQIRATGRGARGFGYAVRHTPQASRADVAGFLERGTSRMAARPFLRAILENAAPAFRRIGRQRLSG